MSTQISLVSATPVGLATIRLRFSTTPKAEDATEADDALNPANYVISGSSTNYVTSAVAVEDDLFAVDLFLAARMAVGSWTLAATSLVSSDGGALIFPDSIIFSVTSVNSQGSLSGGAVNMDVINVLRKHLGSALKGPSWDAVIEGMAAGDATCWNNAKLAFDQLFITSSSGRYLDRNAGDQGIRRPAGVEMADELFRELAVIAKSEKLTQQSLLDILEVFYGVDALRASISTTVNEPYVLENGDDLVLMLDGSQEVTVTFERSEFARMSAALAIEVAAAITRTLRTAGSQGYAATVVDPETGEEGVRIYSGSLGLGSSIQVVGGRSQTELLFPESLFQETGAAPFAIWNATLSTDTPGNVRFTETSGMYDLNQVRQGDLVYIYGTEFAASANQGVFAIREVSVSYSGPTLVQWFEIENPSGTAQNPITQTLFKSLMFIRPVRKTIYDSDRHVIVAETGNGVDVTLPATTKVTRQPGSGAYVRGRREPDGIVLPEDGLKFFMEADYGVTESGGFVSDVLDKSPEGNHVAQTNPLYEPTFVLNAINGHPGIDFNGQPSVAGVITPYLENTLTSLIADGGPRTVISVVKPQAEEGGSIMAFRVGSPDYVAYLINFLGTQFAWSDGFSAISMTTPVDYTGVPLLVEHSNDAAAQFGLNINGSAIPLSSTTIFAESGTTGFTVGNRQVSNTGSYDQGFNGIISMLMVYNRILTDAELTIIRKYVKLKYNIDAGVTVTDGGAAILDLASLVRANGIVTARTIGDHGMVAGDQVIIDGVRATNDQPNITPGTPSGVYVGNIAAGETDASLKTTTSETGTFEGYGQRAFRLAEGMALIVGGIKTGGIVVPEPQVVEITSETILSDGSRQQDYLWTRLATHTTSTGHREFGASMLEDGRVLVTGGTDGTDAAGASNGLWNLFTYTRSPVQDTMVTGALPGVRAGHGQASLQDGRAIICGGWVVNNTPISTTRRFDNLTNAWSAVTSMNTARMRHVAITLLDGTVLVIGGQTTANNALNTCEIYDPNGDTWEYTGRMSIARTAFTAVVLPDGRVLVLGGRGYNPIQGSVLADQASCEIYDPVTHIWAPINPMSVARRYPIVEYLPERNTLLVCGGLGSTKIETLDLTTMKWSVLASRLGTAYHQSAGAIIGEDTFAVIGGIDNTDLVLGSTDNVNFLTVPGHDTFGGGGLNGLHRVLSAPDATSFTYTTDGHDSYAEAAAGATATPTAALTGLAGIPGPYVYDLDAGVATTGTETTLTTPLSAGQSYQSIEVGDASEFPDEEGYLVFNFGQATQVSPVKYLGRLSSTELLLDAGFVFTHDVDAGDVVTLLSGRTPFQPAEDAVAGNFYLTGSAAGRVAAEAAVADTVAAGVDLNKTIVYPGDSGVGGEGRLTHGAPKLSDIVQIFGGDDLDAEMAALRSQS